ncbi:MAG: outer membrane protein TolC [Flavobacteriales bacterium]|jgi:outer membrane protein TolC
MIHSVLTSSCLKQFWLVALLLLSFFLVEGQSPTKTGEQLSYERFFEIVQKEHPVSKQATLRLEIGTAEVQKSRGAFDPKIHGDVGQKYFDGQQYYSLIDGGLKIPTWFGIELGAGYDVNEGVFLNPENSVPSLGLWHAGISIPVGQGLFIDQRRADLRKAQIYQESTTVEQRAMMNELLYEAGEAYWEWYQAYNLIEVYQSVLQTSTIRFQGVKQSSALGDRPAIDTLEAGIQVQNRQLLLEQAQLLFKNKTAFLQVFLWAGGRIPLELDPNTIPFLGAETETRAPSLTLISEMESLIANHPELIIYDLKIDQLEIEQRWKREQLKPVANLKYNSLAENNADIQVPQLNNYTWGIEVQMPLFLRKERAALEMARIKIKDTSFSMDMKRASLISKAQMAMNDWNTNLSLITLYTQTVLDYQNLLLGERRMFNAGESSLFLINSREMSYISAQIKLIELQIKAEIAALKVQYAAGVLWEKE